MGVVANADSAVEAPSAEEQQEFAQAVETPIVSDEGSASPGPETAGDQQAAADEDGLTLSQVLESPDLMRKAYEAGVTPEDFRQAILEEAGQSTEEKARAEAQRIREQEREAEEAIREREGLFTELDTSGRTAARYLVERVNRYNQLADSDPDAAVEALTERSPTGRLRLFDAIEAVRTGTVASVSLDFARQVESVLEAHKDAMEGADKEELRKARYQFATKGDAGPLLKLAFTTVAGHEAQKAEQKGEQKGEKKAAENLKAAEILARLKRPVAPGINGGSPVTTTERRAEIARQIDALDPYKLSPQEFEAEERRLRKELQELGR